MFDSPIVGDPFALFPIQAVGTENGIYLFVEHRNSHTLLKIGFPIHALFTSVVFHGTLVQNSTPTPPYLFPGHTLSPANRAGGDLFFRHINVARDEYAVSQNGMKLFDVRAT
jgi:hypothetical protein